MRSRDEATRLGLSHLLRRWLPAGARVALLGGTTDARLPDPCDDVLAVDALDVVGLIPDALSEIDIVVVDGTSTTGPALVPTEGLVQHLTGVAPRSAEIWWLVDRLGASPAGRRPPTATSVAVDTVSRWLESASRRSTRNPVVVGPTGRVLGTDPVSTPTDEQWVALLSGVSGDLPEVSPPWWWHWIEAGRERAVDSSGIVLLRSIASDRDHAAPTLPTLLVASDLADSLAFRVEARPDRSLGTDPFERGSRFRVDGLEAEPYATPAEGVPLLRSWTRRPAADWPALAREWVQDVLAQDECAPDGTPDRLVRDSGGHPAIGTWAATGGSAYRDELLRRGLLRAALVLWSTPGTDARHPDPACLAVDLAHGLGPNEAFGEGWLTRAVDEEVRFRLLSFEGASSADAAPDAATRHRSVLEARLAGDRPAKAVRRLSSRVADLELATDDLAGQLAGARAERDALEARVEALEATLAQTRDHSEHLDRTLAHEARLRVEAEARADRSDALAAQAEQALLEVYGSRSWRVTAPLRRGR